MKAAIALLSSALLSAAGAVEPAARDVRTSRASSSAKPSTVWDQASGQVTLVNGRLELVVETKSGMNARLLRDLRSGCVYADADYCWPRDAFPTLEAMPTITRQPDGGCSVVLAGRLGDMGIQQALAAPAGEPGVILETVTISNPSDRPVDTAGFKCGFAKRVRQGEAWTPDATGIRFCPVPYRRETDGKLQEFPLREVAEHGTTFAGWSEAPQPTPIWGAEGWVWSQGAAFLIAKYHPDSMEWSLMEPVRRGAETVIRFGGAGQWKHGHPEGSTRLGPGESYTFGETRLEAVEGDWQQAYYAHRRWLESKGCTTPAGYDPPVHWNELYDNEYFFKVGAVLNDRKVWYTADFDARNKELLHEFYSRDLMLAEAAKAKELHCQALYLDPGWDTGPSHHLWDASRLGSMGSFVGTIREQYGLGISLWIGMGGMPPTYADPKSCPPEARVTSQDGKVTPIHCFAAPAFLDTKTERLLELCRQGVAFLMFDSTQFSGPCYDPKHGHQVPSTREEHAAALFELARRIKTKYPRVLIEIHDPITGPSSVHYTPTYFGYAPPRSFDCLWGHEFMWNPLDDLLSRRAVSLYYFNLAYSIPLYLHVNLKGDNEQALVFWWYASACRHLGVGGKPPAAVWEAEKKAMQTYRSLKRFYAQGVFYGLEEMTHAHTLPELGESVINAFNLDEAPVAKPIRFRLGEIGLPPGSVRIDGVTFQQDGDEIAIELAIPARGHRLLRVRATAAQR